MLSIEFSVTPPKEDTLHFNSIKQSVKAYLTALRFVDKDTKQYVIYIPAFEMSGYGKTAESAHHMLNETLESFFKFLLDLPDKQLKDELSKLGWKKNILKDKDFSAPLSAIDKKVKELNADGKIERLALVA